MPPCSGNRIRPGGYDHAVQVISEQRCDLYITSHKVHFGNDVYEISPPYKVGIYRDSEIKKVILPQAYGFLKGRDRLHGFMWKQVYDKKVLIDTDISLIEDLKPWEDQVFNIDMMQHCDSVYVDDIVLYNYFANTGSVTSSMINSFDVEEFWKKTRLLYLEKSKRSTNSLENRANANASLANIDSLIVCLCKNHSLSTSSIVKQLRSLIRKDVVAEKILKESVNRDLSKRFCFVRFCLRLDLYRFLVSVVRLMLVRPRL